MAKNKKDKKADKKAKGNKAEKAAKAVKPEPVEESTASASVVEAIEALEGAALNSLGLAADEFGIEVSITLIPLSMKPRTASAPAPTAAKAEKPAKSNKSSKADDAVGDDDGEDDESGDTIYTLKQLKKLDVAGLKAILSEYDITTKVRTAEKLVDMVVEAQSAWCAENDVEDPNAPEGGDDDGDESWTEDELEEKAVGELRAIAKDYDIATKGMSKAELIEAILGTD